MPAHVRSQLPALREEFRSVIRRRLQDKKADLLASVDEDLPSWISWAARPVVSLGHDLMNIRDGLVGRVGEAKAAAVLRVLLPSRCVLMNDIVLETLPDEFIQIDHVVISPSGIYLIETKAWDGAILGHGDSWKRKDGDRWVRCQSPTRQNERHARLLKVWLSGVLTGSLPGACVHPLVLFTRAKWLRAENSPMRVYRSPLWMSLDIRRDLRCPVLTEEDTARIVDAVVHAKPLVR